MGVALQVVYIALMCFLATWARRLSWSDVARAFGTSWDNVRQAVAFVVEYGLAHRDLKPVALREPKTA